MRNLVRVARLALVPGFALITTGMASVAEADSNLNKHLRGAYAFTEARTCVDSFVLPGDDFLIQPEGGVIRNTATVNGITTYNGDGTATAIGRVSNINTLPGNGGPYISLTDIATVISYTVNPDATVDTTGSSTLTGVFPASVAGTSGTSTGMVNRLQMSLDKTMLVSAPQEQVSVEPHVFKSPDGVESVRYRMCIRSTTQIKLKPD